MVHPCVFGCYFGLQANVALRTAFFWVITQRVVVISYRSFGIAYGSYPQGSRLLIPEDWRRVLSYFGAEA